MYFFHPDHLGSITMITDGNGNVLAGGERGGKSHITYKPYGEILRTDSSGPDITKFKYTGQEEDQESGLYYYKARYYDASLGRFASNDGMVFPEKEQGMNRMMYVEGNPILWRDQSGHKKDFSIYGALIGYMVAPEELKPMAFFLGGIGRTDKNIVDLIKSIQRKYAMEIGKVKSAMDGGARAILRGTDGGARAILRGMDGGVRAILRGMDGGVKEFSSGGKYTRNKGNNDILGKSDIGRLLSKYQSDLSFANDLSGFVTDKSLLWDTLGVTLPEGFLRALGAVGLVYTYYQLCVKKDKNRKTTCQVGGP
ncbi:RHS repeat domain-containing protein [Leptospira meyeri]|uniref:RHS repeat domain-containing protein n=1 Tax=Leptospira meyeri TaxID=29508 RepID=UPI001FD26247|nr:RHS repeat-associated core domain-containing protein [Leptospira meyeri]